LRRTCSPRWLRRCLWGVQVFFSSVGGLYPQQDRRRHRPAYASFAPFGHQAVLAGSDWQSLQCRLDLVPAP